MAHIIVPSKIRPVIPVHGSHIVTQSAIK